MKKVLITGGAGFIGFHLAEFLVKKGYKVVIVDNFSRGVEDEKLTDLLNKGNFRLLKHNLLDSKTLNAWIISTSTLLLGRWKI